MTLKDLSELEWKYQCSKTQMRPDYVPKTKFTDKTSAGLEKCICAYIKLNGGMAERRKNTGRYIDDSKIVTDITGAQRVIGKGKYIPGTGRNGTPDCSGIWKGRPIGIEVKIGKDRMSQAQIEYREDFEKAGGIFIIAKTFTQFVEELNKV